MKTVIEISALEQGAVEIMFADGTSLLANHDLVRRYGIKASLDIDDDTLDKLINEVGDDQCYEAALRLIEFRPRSENELKQRLLSKHAYSTAAIDRALQRLKTSGLLNDRVFAEAWANDRIKFKPRSRFMIQRELMHKGVSLEDIAGAIDDINDSENAYLTGLKKARLLQSSDRLKFYSRLSSYLARRGYSAEVVHTVVNRLWREISQK